MSERDFRVEMLNIMLASNQEGSNNSCRLRVGREGARIDMLDKRHAKWQTDKEANRQIIKDQSLDMEIDRQTARRESPQAPTCWGSKRTEQNMQVFWQLS